MVMILMDSEKMCIKLFKNIHPKMLEKERLDRLEERFRKLCRIVFHHGHELSKSVKMELEEYRGLIEDLK